MPEEKFLISIKCLNCEGGWFHPWERGFASFGKEVAPSEKGTPFHEIKCDHCGKVYDLHEIYSPLLYRRYVNDRWVDGV